ncbi:MAG: hypothetical protein AB7Q29_14215 [Vicinamibacterales bacterium]
MKEAAQRALDVGGLDPIDSRLGGASGVTRGRWMSRRLALGLASAPMPASALLLVGAAVGPLGLGLLTPPVLAALQPATTAALVALGVLIGLDIELVRRSRVPRPVAGASLESGLTLLGVSLVFVALATRPWWSWPGLALLPWMLGVAAGGSATPTTGDSPTVAGRLGDLDDLLPIVAGGVLLAVAAGESAVDAVALFATAVLLAAVIAFAGSLLVAETASEDEQRVYAMGTLLLLTGVAAYLSASALLVGMLAGATWNASTGGGRDRLARDFQYLQHPVVVLLLVVAGARASITVEMAALGGVFALVRVGGKVAGGALAAGVVPGLDSRVGLGLLASGAGGAAFALSAFTALDGGTAAEALVSIVVVGAVLSDLLALLVSPQEARA